ncbi:MAG: tripartite tricarboxylate transporter TctB family protein [Alphaproteobacteria bacterium]|nr:tripartite tricarboxylate transporter TctB family protein [Alphaproteobacteria bacterium]
MNRVLDICVSGVLLMAAIGLFALTFTDQFDVPTFGGDVGPAFAPRGFLLVWMGLAAVATFLAVRRKAGEPGEPVRFGQLFVVVLIAAGTGVAMINIGFLFAMVPGFFLFCWAFGYREVLQLAVISIVGPVAVWALFTFGFELLLPRSPWFHIL